MASRARAAGVPVKRLTVLYDARCSLCLHLRNWLGRQRQLVPLVLLPAGSDEARWLYPHLDHHRTLREITAVGDRGQVFSGAAAWIVCLWALAEHRPRAHWLATPAGAPFVRATMLAAAKYRELATAQTAPDTGAGPAQGTGPSPAGGRHLTPNESTAPSVPETGTRIQIGTYASTGAATGPSAVPGIPGTGGAGPAGVAGTEGVTAAGPGSDGTGADGTGFGPPCDDQCDLPR